MASEYKKMLALQKMYETGQIPANKAKRKALAEKLKNADPYLKKNPDKLLKPGSVYKEGGSIPDVDTYGSSAYKEMFRRINTGDPTVTDEERKKYQIQRKAQLAKLGSGSAKSAEAIRKERQLGQKSKKVKKDTKDEFLKPGSVHKEGGKIPSFNAKDRMKKYR